MKRLFFAIAFPALIVTSFVLAQDSIYCRTSQCQPLHGNPQ